MRPEYLEKDREMTEPSFKKGKLNKEPANDNKMIQNDDDVSIAVNENVELNKNGNAKKNTENYMLLIDLIKEFPILWNHKIPILERNPLAKSKAWNQILQNFPGWSKEFMMKKFNSLKEVYTRRKSHVPSGSAQRAQRYWIFDDSFSFLNDVIAPAATISNVPASNAPEENNNNDKVLSELGFNVKGKGPVAEMTKSTRKKQTPFDAGIMKCIETLSSPPPQVQFTSCEQFGIFIGKELEKLDNDYQRMDAQIKIMKVLQDAICR
ncbi:uncharacterized protein LOC127284035 [Leptopilina boulardi]|uniref:uncharacterized protein LOC127284035 n=1 Tax=Leptopilina boulardi TaxID=63433 RepID=UPI0021F50057|nr:uncharacterized protein LOC127284035 [Leptopilina boulardi]